MELNAEQIKKALECCASSRYQCEECPIDQKKKDDCECGTFLAKNALKIVNAQEQKIFALENRLKSARKVEGMLYLEKCKCREAVEKIKELTVDNERVREKADRNLENLKAVLEERDENTIKSDTVRKMREMLCEGRVSNDPVVIAVNVAVKEMLEGKNG
jgi:hypothetical protein